MRRLAALALLCTMAAAARAQAQDEADRVEVLARAIRDRAMAGASDLSGDAIVAWSVSLAEGAPDPDGLGRRLTAPLIAALRDDPRFVAVDAWERAGTDVAALSRRAAMRDYEAIFVLRAEARGHFLHAELDVVRAARGRGLRDLFLPSPERLDAFALRRKLDAHLRRYAGALPRVTDATVVARPLALPSRGYLAMVAADLDGDGGTELVLSRADRVDVVRLGASARGTPRLVTVGSAPIAGLPAPPSRIRRPIATAVRTERGAIVRTSEAGAPFLVTLADGAVTVAPREGPCGADAFPLPDGCAVPVTGRDYFVQALVPRAGATAPPEAPSGFYARAAREMPVPDGSTTRIEAVVTPRGRLAVRVGERAGGAVGYGAALGMADLEDDGLMELLVSSGDEIGAGDRVSLLRLRTDGGVIAVWTSEPMEGSVLVAGAADLDDDGRDELLAIEEPREGRALPAHLWVIR